ncbi:GNAT family N-acetyltransferase [Vreelandella aquamarina]|uniref:GNAT family N-acetyltransferase n=1 Tax=Vreelandella aquamarina TaxID=77097 RepID=UPI00384C3E58
MEIVVKRASLEDAENVATLFNDYRVFYKQESNITVALEFISERLDKNESVIFFAQDAKGVLIGFTQLYPNFSSVSAKRSWILNDLYVSSAARRLGVARKLMNAAKDFAISTGAKGISLETAPDNVNAQALYESLGYEKSSGFYSYYLSV